MNSVLMHWLVEAGLDKQRATIYLALLARYESGVTALAADLGMNRTALYDNLAHLEQRGFVVRYKKGRSLVYRALKPDELEAKYKSHLQQLHDLMPLLQSLANSRNNLPVIERFHGRYSARYIFEDILRKRPSEYCYISNPVETYKMVTRKYITRWIDERVERGIRARGIRTVKLTSPDDAVFSQQTQYLRQLRYLPPGAVFSASVYVYADTVGLISSSRENETLLINSADIAHTFQNFFEILWGISAQ